MKRDYLWMALRFPYLPLEVLGIDIRKDACVIASQHKKISFASLPCANDGVRIGMPAATARLLSNCEIRMRNPEQESLRLTALSDEFYNYTPYIKTHCLNFESEYAQQGLLLELSRCISLFKGLEQLTQLLWRVLERSGLYYCHGLAANSKEAWLRSWCDSDTREALFNLPVEKLEEFPDKIDLLKKTGFLVLGDIRQQLKVGGAHAFKKRFGSDFVEYLYDIFESAALESEEQNDLFSPSLFNATPLVYSPVEHYRGELQFDYPLNSIEWLAMPMRQLADDLCLYLVAHQQQCFLVQWCFYDIYHNCEKMELRCERIHRDSVLLLDLSLIQLEQQGLPFEVDALELRCLKTAEVDFVMESLPIQKAAGISGKLLAEQEKLTARIRARLGEKNVFKVKYVDEHFPELANAKVEIHDSADAPLQGPHRYGNRPDWIFNTPVAIGKHQNQLHWHGRLHLIRGPERIEGHWWDSAAARDYFVAMREDHVRLWVYNDLLKKEWFVQGVF